MLLDTGGYTFELDSDDGSRMYLEGGCSFEETELSRRASHQPRHSAAQNDHKNAPRMVVEPRAKWALSLRPSSTASRCYRAIMRLGPLTRVFERKSRRLEHFENTWEAKMIFGLRGPQDAAVAPVPAERLRSWPGLVIPGSLDT